MKDYKFSDENFGRISLESNEIGIDNSSTNDIEIGNGLVMVFFILILLKIII
jgi:hypothetical protein